MTLPSLKSTTAANEAQKPVRVFMITANEYRQEGLLQLL